MRFRPKDEEWLCGMMCHEEFDVFRSDRIFNLELRKDVEQLRKEVQKLERNYQPRQTDEAPIKMKIVLE